MAMNRLLERELGMQKVEVKKDALVEKLTTNRADHRAVFLKAQDRYKTEVIAQLEQMLDEARAGKRIRHVVELEAPVDHTRDYDRVLAMLDMSVQDTVTLTAAEFECYVMDRWPWLSQFASNSLSYGLSSKYTDMSGDE